MYRPPCQTGLTVWGVLCLVGAGLVLLGIVVGVMGILMIGATVGGAVGGRSVETVGALLLAVVAIYGMIIGVLVMMGVGMLRRKRWVRPWVLTGSAWMMLVTCVSFPVTTFSMWHTASVSGGAGLVMVLVALSMFAIMFGLSWSLFRYFRKPEMVATLNFFDRGGSRLERWPVPVFGVGVVAVFSGVAGLLGVVIPVVDLGRGVSAAAVVSVAGTLLSAALYVAGGVWCFRQPARGWRVLMAAILLGFAQGVVMYAVFPEFMQRIMEQAASGAGGGAAAASVQPSWITFAQAVSGLVAYAGALWWLRKWFLEPMTEATVAAGPTPVVPISNIP